MPLARFPRKSTLDGFLLQLLLRFREYILKQFFFSIWVNSGRIFTSISKTYFSESDLKYIYGKDDTTHGDWSVKFALPFPLKITCSFGFAFEEVKKCVFRLSAIFARP